MIDLKSCTFIIPVRIESEDRIRNIITVLCYLNDVSEGGSTVFPNINKEVFPEAGKIAVFHNCFPGTDTPNPGSLHGASPVLSGEKWAINLWFRKNKVEQEH